MFFFDTNQTSKTIDKRVLHSIKSNKKHMDKRRSFLANGADSWRKKVHFPNMLSKNSFSWLFGTKFSMFVLNSCFGVVQSLFVPFLKNSAILHLNNKLLGYNLMFIILIYKNYFLYFPVSIPNLFIEKSFLRLNKNNSSLAIYNFFFFWVNFGLLDMVKRWFSRIEKSVYCYIFLKLRYKGKNHRWHRRKKGLVLRFGHSHLISLKKPTSVFLKKKGRMKILFFGTNIELLYFFLRNIVNWKPANVYTGRGLRISRQKILRKSGKVSIYR